MAILIDTGVYFAKYNEDDKNHGLAQEIFTDIVSGKYGQPYLLDYVFDEFVTLAQTRTKRNDVATQLGNKLLDAKYHELIRVNHDIFRDAWHLFQNQTGRRGKYLSFTDCCLISAAKILSMSYIATLEGNFMSVDLERVQIVQE